MGPGFHVIWITSRAAGIAALLLASTAVAVGLMMSFSRKRTAEWKTVHETLSLATLGAIALHGVAILADPWLKPGLPGVLVPFQVDYRPLAVAAGIVAAYGLAGLGLSYYLRSRLGPALWRRMHRWTALFWLLAVLHGVTAGSDAGSPWFISSLALVVVPATLLLGLRLASRLPRTRSDSAPISALEARPL